ncbi:MAG: ankyrin repeat domain-containing protein [Bryobacterales bacterium]|nr:ankyrin repeat domain-containing protein [Bryobacterales bacterium]
MPDQLIARLRNGELAAVREYLTARPAAAKSPRPVVEAGRLAWKQALAELLKHGADLNSIWRGYRALHALLQEEPHADGKPPLPAQARLDCLDWLLANGADPELAGAWPPARALLIAAFTGIEPFVQRLKDGGARVNFHAHCALGDLRKAKAALKADGASAQARDDGGLTALQCCAASRMPCRDTLRKIAALLLDAGADPNAVTKGWSHQLNATYFAAASGHLQMFELLLERGADPTLALPSAAWRKEMDFAEAALRHGADLNQRFDQERPILNELIRWGQVQQALWMLEKGADPNIPDEKGWTAVHQAASRGNERMWKAVLEAGGDLKRKDNLGLTPSNHLNLKLKGLQ